MSHTHLCICHSDLRHGVPWLAQQFTNPVLQPEKTVVIEGSFQGSIMGVREECFPGKVNSKLLPTPTHYAFKNNPCNLQNVLDRNNLNDGLMLCLKFPFLVKFSLL